MKVLITCARAPVSIDWIKIFSAVGATITVVDSVSFPISKGFKNTHFIKVASPRLDFENYQKQIKTLINQVDWVIPNCEDIFYLSKVRDSMQTKAFFFMPENNLLLRLHDKYNFFEYINHHVKQPKTVLIEDKIQIKFDKNTILKPVFSRFGTNIISEVNDNNIKNIQVSKQYSWVQQQRIEGISLCNYALILKGKVVAHCAYRAKYLLNGATVYFESYQDDRLDDFINEFASTTNYTGQVAFDFIDNGKNIYILECNPRATSGLHLLTNKLTFTGTSFTYNQNMPVSYNAGFMFYLVGVKYLLSKNAGVFIKDCQKSKSILADISIFRQIISIFGFLSLTLMYKKSIVRSSTVDMEYNGE